MNEILVLTDAFKGLKTTLKNKRRYIWVFLVSFLIGWAILLIFWPSPKPARAEVLYYQNVRDAIEAENQVMYQYNLQQNFTSPFTGFVKSVITYPYGDCDFVSGSYHYVLMIYNLTTSVNQRWATPTLPKTGTGGCIFDTTILGGSGLQINEGDNLWIQLNYIYPNSKIPENRFYGSASDTIPSGSFAEAWGYNPIVGVADFSFQFWDSTTTDDYHSPDTPSLEITSPADGSAQTTNFDIEATYDLLEEDYDRTMIIFEDWDASSTCPIYGTTEYTNEMALGYFNNQSQPYFSDFFATSTGTTSVAVSDLAKGNYRCVRCYFINETTNTISAELCNGYGIEIPNTLPLTIPTYYQGQNWATFYETNSDKWATSTELFTYLAGKTAPLLLWVGNFTADFKNLFNNASSSAMGQQLGSAIPQARGYLTIINYYFAGIPIGEVFIFYLLTALVLIVLKIVLMIWHFFRG